MGDVGTMRRAGAAGGRVSSLENCSCRHVLRRRVDGRRSGRARLRAAAAISPRSATLHRGSLTLDHVARFIDARSVPIACRTSRPPSIARTAGDPFIIVNAIDSLVAPTARGRGARRMAMCHVARGHRPRAAGTLGEVITRHVDHLDPLERESAEAADRVAPEFAATSVAAALEQRVEHVPRRVLGPLADAGRPHRRRRRDGPFRCGRATYRFRHPLYADLIAQQAPMLRQLRVVQRLSPRPRHRLTRPRAVAREVPVRSVGRERHDMAWRPGSCVPTMTAFLLRR